MTSPRHPLYERIAPHVLEIKRGVFRQAEASGGGYLGQGLGIAEIAAALYFHQLRVDPARPDWPDRDRFVLSPGHYTLAFYAALALRGFFPASLLDTSSADGSPLELISTESTPGIEVGGGSLGQGLSQGVGMALAARRRGAAWRTYVLTSDGELEEGQTWEAAMVAGHFHLENLTAFVDVNGMQVDGRVTSVATVEPVAEKWAAFGWHVSEIDGNDLSAVLYALEAGVPTKTHVLNLLHRLVDERPPVTPEIDPPKALALIEEPRANVQRYDGLRSRIAGGRHAS